MMGDAITGCLQLSVNGHPTETFNACVHNVSDRCDPYHPYPRILRVSTAFMTSQWGVDQLDDFRSVSVDFFVKREAYTVEAMRNIACPVCIVHCGADIAYDITTTNQVADHLRTAGVSVEVVQIPNAPHFGATTHPKECVLASLAVFYLINIFPHRINAVFHKFMLSLCSGVPPKIPDQVQSPFKNQLIAVGWDSDSDEEPEFFI